MRPIEPPDDGLTVLRGTYSYDGYTEKVLTPIAGEPVAPDGTTLCEVSWRGGMRVTTDPAWEAAVFDWHGRVLSDRLVAYYGPGALSDGMGV